jgi:hypothetical protein
MQISKNTHPQTTTEVITISIQITTEVITISIQITEL